MNCKKRRLLYLLSPLFASFGTELDYSQSNYTDMVVVKKQNQQADEKKWENPLNPGEPGDARDKEQIQRQYKEAKRRHDNLSENQNKAKQ